MATTARAISLTMICVCLGLVFGVGVSAQVRGKTIRIAERPDVSAHNTHYVSNRAPLAPSALIKLPIGAIRPEGWLRKQLQLQADGLNGHLTEISSFLRKDGNAWLSASGEGDHGWEEAPYWLKGFVNCAYVLNDEQMIAEAKVWIEAALASQKSDGWFGPDQHRKGAATRLTGRSDLWPNMIMLFCLQDYFDATGDKRVLTLMTRYFQYLHTVPEDRFLLGYWPKMRAGDQLFTIYWLYNRTGDEWLLELAEKTHRGAARWDTDVINWHNVNMGQAFAEGATWWLQSKADTDLQSAYRNWDKIRAMYGQVPGGLFGGDENCRPGYSDPRQAVETCGIVEAMLSQETLVAITGDLTWADRCEDIAFNSLPAALTADMKALRYLTAPNQVVSDARSHSPGIQNRGPMFLMAAHLHRCCQHDHGHGWPYFAQHLWYATPDNGLAAVFYSASSVTADVGKDGTTVTVEEQTHYPFDESVTLTVRCAEPVVFPLSLRIPGWCERPTVKLNGRDCPLENSKPRQFIVLDRKWTSGDTIELKLPMQVKLRVWEQNHHSVSVDRGPLTYSLKIGEKYVQADGPDDWPTWEIHPTSPWNEALVLAPNDPATSFQVVQRAWPNDDMPWTQTGVPIQLQAKGRRVPQWKLDRYGLCATLQDSPVKTDAPVEPIKLIPMGAARLRVSAFPVAGSGADAHEWAEPQYPEFFYRPTASYTCSRDTTDALADGLDPKSSDDGSIPRHTFWPHKGTAEWLQAEFSAPKTVRTVAIYWFDDTGRGGCRVPQSWRLLYRDGTEWKPVPFRGDHQTFSVKRDTYNRVSVLPVTTTALRVELQLRERFSGGVLEWKID